MDGETVLHPVERVRPSRAERRYGYGSRMSAMVGRLPVEADLVCCWFEEARWQVAAWHATRAKHGAMNPDRGGPSRRVLEAVTSTCRITFLDGNKLIDPVIEDDILCPQASPPRC